MPSDVRVLTFDSRSIAERDDNVEGLFVLSALGTFTQCLVPPTTQGSERVIFLLSG